MTVQKPLWSMQFLQLQSILLRYQTICYSFPEKFNKNSVFIYIVYTNFIIIKCR